jgi:hypothetical protein
MSFQPVHKLQLNLICFPEYRFSKQPKKLRDENKNLKLEKEKDT